MSARLFVEGVVILALIVAPLWFAATRMRVRFFTDWSGATATLGDSIIFLALLETLTLTLGSFGLLHRGPLVVLCVVVALAIVVTVGDARAPRRRDSTPVALAPIATIVAIVMVAVTPWLARTLSSLRTGMGGYDSLSYHLPFAADYFQDGRTTSLIYTLPRIETPFDPANSELFHAIGMIATRREVLSPLLNLGWLVLALLAAWCVGRRRGIGVLTLSGVAALLATPVTVVAQGGRASNDIVGVALFLAAIGILVASRGGLSVTALAAAACGFALGSKFSLVVPAVALSIGVIAIADPGRKIRTAAAWLVAILITGGYWYVRNLIVVGNPIPPLHLGIGPVAFPQTHVDPLTPMFSVADYFGDFGVWRAWFVPGLREAFGWTWPVLLGCAATGWVLAIVRGDRMLRMLGIVGLVSFVGYLFTPYGAAGPEGQPILFAVDTRFAFPSLALGLVLLPLAAPATRSVRVGIGALYAVALLGDVIELRRLSTSFVAAAIVIEVAVLALLAIAMLLQFGARGHPRRRPVLLPVIALAITFGLAGGCAMQRMYFQNRYTNISASPPYSSAPRSELHALNRWIDGIDDARIAVVGLPTSYPLYGVDLDNDVQYVGRHDARGAFNEITTCREWKDALNAHPYDYVVVTARAAGEPSPIETRWTLDDAAARRIMHEGSASVFEVVGRFDPRECAGQPNGGSPPR